MGRKAKGMLKFQINEVTQDEEGHTWVMVRVLASRIVNELNGAKSIICCGEIKIPHEAYMELWRTIKAAEGAEQIVHVLSDRPTSTVAQLDISHEAVVVGDE